MASREVCVTMVAAVTAATTIEGNQASRQKKFASGANL